MPVPIIATGFSVVLSVAPGAGTWTFNLLRQGATIATIAVTGATTSASTTFTGAYLVGETLTVRATPTGSPANTVVAFVVTYGPN
jgi:hypothetical protein